MVEEILQEREAEMSKFIAESEPLYNACRFIDHLTGGECPMSHDYYKDSRVPADGRFSWGDCEENCDAYTKADPEFPTAKCWEDWFIAIADGSVQV